MSATKFWEEHVLQEIERKAHSDVTARRFVKANASACDECDPAGANDAAVGVALIDGDAGESIRIATHGIVMIDTGDTIVAMDELVSDADGKAVPKGTATAMVTPVRAIALTGAASGEQVSAVLTFYGADALPHLGTSASPLARTTATNFGQLYARSTVATGTARGLYLRHYFAGGVGGEVLRAFATCEHAAPADTVNGAHVSLNFGASAGNISGLGTALRATLHVNARSIGGTTAALMGELYGEASGDVGGSMSCLRLAIGGDDATAKGNLDTKAHIMEIVATAGSGKAVKAGSTLGTAYGGFRVLVNGVAMYIPLYAAAPS